MKKTKKSAILFFASLAIIIAMTSFTGCHYFFKTIIYQRPNIDDVDLFPYRTVKAGDHKTPWKKADDYNKTALPDELREMLEGYDTVAFLVIKDNKIKFEEYWDGYSQTKGSNSFSAAKSVVSILVGIALKQGYIKSLDQPVGDFLPEFADGAKKDITIRDVLMMASGLNFNEEYNKVLSHTTEAYYGTDLRGLINSLEVIEKPGTIYQYRSGDTELLAMVLVAATGKSISQFATENLWGQIGAMEDVPWNLDKEGGIEKAYCCFYSNARDFARVGNLYLNKGEVDGKPLVDRDYMEKSITPINIPDRQGENVDFYGYQWWLYNYADTPVFYARGFLGQYVFVFPEKNMIVVRLGHKRSKVKVNHHPEDVYVIVDNVLKTF